MRKAKTTHTAFFTGSKIRMVFRDGSVIIAKFKEKHGRKLVTDKGSFNIIDISAASYYKPLQHEL